MCYEKQEGNTGTNNIHGNRISSCAFPSPVVNDTNNHDEDKKMERNTSNMAGDISPVSQHLPIDELGVGNDTKWPMHFPHSRIGHYFSTGGGICNGFDGVAYYITNDPEGDNPMKLPKEVEICITPYMNGNPSAACNVKYGVETGEIKEFNVENKNTGIPEGLTEEELKAFAGYMISIFARFAHREWLKTESRKLKADATGYSKSVKKKKGVSSNNDGIGVESGKKSPKQKNNSQNSGASPKNKTSEKPYKPRKNKKYTWVRHGYYRIDGVYIKSCICHAHNDCEAI